MATTKSERRGGRKPGTSAALKKKKWFTNGATTVRSETCPDGFWPGTTQRTVKGMKWWNNGSITKRAHECPGPDFTLGKLDRHKNNAKKNIGKHWFNDGFRNVREFECPPGFVKGRLSLKKGSKRMYHDPITREHALFEENQQPIGWLPGYGIDYKPRR